MPAVRATITLITAGAAVTVVRPVASVALDPLARNPVLAENPKTADQFVRVAQFQRTPGDGVRTLEVVLRGVGKSLTDAVGATDDLGGALSLDDDQTLVFAKTVSESTLLADAIASRIISKPVSDGSTAGDEALKAYSKPAQEALNVSDLAGRTVQFVRGLPQAYVESGYFAEKYHETDEAIFSDAARRTVGKAVADTSRATDAETFALGKPVSDTARATDADVLSIGKPLSPLYVYHGYFAERYTDIDTDVFTVSDSDVISLSKPFARTSRVTDAGAVFKQDYVGSSTYFAEFYTGTGSTW